MLVTISWIKEHYDKFNKLYFGDTLPTVKFKINRTKNSFGFAGFQYDFLNDTIIPDILIMSNYYDSPEYVKIQTLLHEMIHIEDYFWHPEHFIRNHKRVSARVYDAHGTWFLDECKRISKESGYNIGPVVTWSEIKASRPSNYTKKLVAQKVNNALICAVYGTKGVWYFKTDINKVDYLKKKIPTTYNWTLTIGEYKKIKFYTFDNPKFAKRRSCCTRIVGWKLSHSEFIKKMIEFKATEVHF